MTLLFCLKAHVVYKSGHYLESEALRERAKDTAIYSIAVGVGLLVGMGVLFCLLGVGDHFEWFSDFRLFLIHHHYANCTWEICLHTIVS